jgi:hypothetical protein
MTGASPTRRPDARRTPHVLLSSIPNAPPPRPRSASSRTDRVLTWIAVLLVLAGVILGVSKHGQPLAPRARELFIPGGLVLLVVAWRGRRRAPAAGLWISLVALALIGIGAHEAVSGPWTLLAVPGAVLACLACVRSALRGPRDPFFERMRWGRSASSLRASKPRSLAVTRLWLAFLALMLACGAGFAVAGAIPPGPTVDVQVVPVAYGLHTQAESFGIAVRNAHCSSGATAYTVDVDGSRFELSCTETSGREPRTVMVGLSAGHSYTVTIRAVQTRAGRSARAGNSRKLTVRVPGADSKGWQANS